MLIVQLSNWIGNKMIINFYQLLKDLLAFTNGLWGYIQGFNDNDLIELIILRVSLFISILLMVFFFFSNQKKKNQLQKYKQPQFIFKKIENELGNCYDIVMVDQFYYELIKPLSEKFCKDATVKDNYCLKKLMLLLKDQTDASNFLELIESIILYINSEDYNKSPHEIMPKERYLKLEKGYQKNIKTIVNFLINYKEITDVISLLSKSISKREEPCDYNYKSINENTRSQIDELFSFIKEYLNVDLTHLQNINSAINDFNIIWNKWKQTKVLDINELTFVKHFKELSFIHEIATFMIELAEFSSNMKKGKLVYNINIFSLDFPRLPDELISYLIQTDRKYKKEEEYEEMKTYILSLMNQIFQKEFDSSINNKKLNTILCDLTQQNIKILSYEQYKKDLIFTIESLQTIDSVPTLIHDRQTIVSFLSDIYDNINKLKFETIKTDKMFVEKYRNIITKIRNILLWINYFNLKSDPYFVFLLTKANRIIENMSDLFEVKFDTLPFRQYNEKTDWLLDIPFNSQESYKNVLKFKFFSIFNFLEDEKHTPITKDEYEAIVSSNKADRQSFLINQINNYLEKHPGIEQFSIMQIAELGYQTKHPHSLNKSRVVANKRG